MALTDFEIEQTRNFLINQYNKTGDVNKVISLIDQAYNRSMNYRDSKVRGELAEVFIEIKVRDFVSKNKNVLFMKNMVIPTETGGTTEMDLVVITRFKFILFESKSYYGDKTVSNECLLKSPYVTKDVYKQNLHHLKHANAFFNKCRLSKNHPFKMVLFNYSQGEISDKRTEHWKDTIPLITKDNIDEHLGSFLEGSEKMWDLKKVLEKLNWLEKNQEKLINQHMSKYR